MGTMTWIYTDYPPPKPPPPPTTPFGRKFGGLTLKSSGGNQTFACFLRNSSHMVGAGCSMK